MLKIAALSVVLSLAIAGPVVDWVAVKPASSVREVQASHNKQVIEGAPDEIRQKWSDFKTKHGKWYETVEEETRRFWTFLKNVHKVEEHNKLYEMKLRTYTLGINRYADMSDVEFSHYFLGLKRDYNNTKATDRSTYLSPYHLAAPDTVDWRKKGLVTPVKNQGQCGSCWSFSTTGSLEGQHAKKTGKLISLSEQQLVDCSESYGNHGCEGGLMDQAFQYIEDVGGIESESDYPYRAKDRKRCQFDVSKEVATVSGFKDIPQQDETALKEAVASVGPVSVAIDAGHQDFQLYRDGVYSNPECSSTKLDHGVLVVGYGTEDGQDYWLIKNSWGEEWGLDGYIKIARNQNNMCGVATSASYPLV